MSEIILDLCGGTGAWSEPYKKAGYDVRVVTLPEHDVKLYIPPDNVYGILAAPPCTEFSRAKGSRPRNLEQGMEVVDACLKIIFRCRFAGKLEFWAMENPVGLLRQFLGKPAYTFEHWQFGDMQIKPTDLWGYFKNPKPTVKERPAVLITQFPNGRGNGKGWAKPKCPERYKHLGLDRAAIRAITPPGFAQAFFKANR
jgi:hypothetical protein